MQQELTVFDTISHFYNNFIRTNKVKSNAYKSCLTKIETLKERINLIGMDFPDVYSFDFQTIKNEWKLLPEEVSTGVSTMGLHLEEDYRSILTYFEKDAVLKPHKHTREYEVIKVLEGAFHDLTSKQTFEKGDVFIIPKGQVHEIVTRGEECYMYILFSEDDKHLKLFHREQEIAKQQIKTKKNQ